MPVKKKPFKNFAVLSLLMVVVVLLILGKILVDDANDRLTKTHLRMLPETVRTIFDQHREVADWFSQPPGTTLPEPMVRLSDSLLNIPGIFRLKVWDSHGTILWSDHTELIGENFAQNQHFQLAASGKISYNNEGIRKVENQTEQDERIVIEVYLPVYGGNRIIGVVELYESDKELALLMRRSTESIFIALAVAGLGLYLLMLAAYLLSQDVVTELTQNRTKT